MTRYLFVHAHPDDETLASGALPGSDRLPAKTFKAARDASQASSSPSRSATSRLRPTQ